MADDRIGATMENMHLYEHNGTVWQVPHTTPMTMMGDGFFDSIGNAMGMATHDAEMRNGEMNMLGNAADAMSDDEEMMGRPAKRQMTTYPHSTTMGEQLFEKLGKRHAKKQEYFREIVGPRSAQGLITISAQFVPINEKMLLPAHSLAFAVDEKKPGHVRICNFDSALDERPLPIVGVTLEDALDASTLMKEHESRRTVAIGVAGVVALHCPTIMAREFSFGDNVFVIWRFSQKYQNVELLIPQWGPLEQDCVFCRIGTFVEQIDAQRGGIRLKLDIGQWREKTTGEDDFPFEPTDDLPSRQVSDTPSLTGTQSGGVLDSEPSASQQKAIADQNKELAAIEAEAKNKQEDLIAQAAQAQLEKAQKKNANFANAQQAAEKLLAKVQRNRPTAAQGAKKQDKRPPGVPSSAPPQPPSAEEVKEQKLKKFAQQLLDLTKRKGRGEIFKSYKQIVENAKRQNLGDEVYRAFLETMKTHMGEPFAQAFDKFKIDLRIQTRNAPKKRAKDMSMVLYHYFQDYLTEPPVGIEQVTNAINLILTTVGCNAAVDDEEPENKIYCQMLLNETKRFIRIYEKKWRADLSDAIKKGVQLADSQAALPTPEFSPLLDIETDVAEEEVIDEFLRKKDEPGFGELAKETAEWFSKWLPN